MLSEWALGPSGLLRWQESISVFPKRVSFEVGGPSSGSRNRVIPILYLSLGRDAWCAGGLHSSGLRDPFRHLSETLSGTSAVAHLIGYMPSGVVVLFSLVSHFAVVFGHYNVLSSAFF